MRGTGHPVTTHPWVLNDMVRMKARGKPPDSIPAVLDARHNDGLEAENTGEYEPLGKSTYPDFEMPVEGQEWAIEVARIESGISSYVEIERELDQRGLNRAFGNHIRARSLPVSLSFPAKS